jgi:hypothetical protein
MKTNAASAGGTNLVVIVLGILVAFLIFMALTGRKVPILSSDRAILLAVVVIGLFICSQVGIGRVSAIGAWWHPLSIVGYVLGAIIVLIGVAALFGRNIPPLTSYYQSIAAVAAIAVLKVIVSTIHRLFL